jgi:hypothetical protein
VDRISEAEEHADASRTPQIERSTFYPHRARDPEKPKDSPTKIEVDPVEATVTAAHSEQMRLYFSSTNPPCEWLKQTQEEEARGKRYFEHYEKTGQFLITGPVPTTRVAGLMDVIHEDEEWSYLDDGAPATTSQEKKLALKTSEVASEPAADKGGSSGLRAHDPIDLSSPEAEKVEANQSRSLPPVLKDDGKSTMDISEGNIASSAQDTLALQLEKTGSPFDFLLTSLIRLANFDDYELILRYLVLFFSGFHFGHPNQ